ncbi:MAG: glycosyltransferase family 2 protein, partial [Deltaproteobacteria bacterium]|nr:glycosyltransferase family 2 protein [Deltaproteobacteria bacterium]
MAVDLGEGGMDLSVVVVSWNCKAELLNCLESIVCHARSGIPEVLVVDNASRDGSAEAVRLRFPTVRVIESGANLGFARAANLGLAAARGEYLLFLNPDTLVLTGALDAALHALQSRPTVGILGVRLLDAHGLPQPSCGRFLSLSALLWVHIWRFIAGQRAERRAGDGHLWSGTAVEETDWLVGAFLLCRRAVLQAVGGFDEDYFLYAEDMDLCYRVRQRGYRVLYFPEVAVIHLGNRSGAQKWAE